MAADEQRKPRLCAGFDAFGVMLPTARHPDFTWAKSSCRVSCRCGDQPGNKSPGEIKTRDAPLAQLAEQLTLNQWVPGSSPGGCTKKTPSSWPQATKAGFCFAHRSGRGIFRADNWADQPTAPPAIAAAGHVEDTAWRRLTWPLFLVPVFREGHRAASCLRSFAE